MSLIHDALKSMDAPQEPKPVMAHAPVAQARARSAWLDAVNAGDSDQVAQERAWAAIKRPMPKQIESAEKHDVKSALEDFKRRFGRKN